MKPVLAARFCESVEDPDSTGASAETIRNPNLDTRLMANDTHVQITGPRTGNRVLVPMANVRWVKLPPMETPASRKAS